MSASPQLISQAGKGQIGRLLLIALAAFALMRLALTLDIGGLIHKAEGPPAPHLDAAAAGAALQVAAPEAALRAPLFDPDRKALAAAAPEQTGGPLSKFRLEGVILSRGNRIAHVSEAGSAVIHKLKEGETFNGLVVNEIREDRVIFLDKGAKKELLLVQPPGADSPAPGP